MRTVIWLPKFKKDYALAIKRNYKIELLDDIILKLARCEKLPPQNKDHQLKGKLSKYRECHIKDDWILIYRIENNNLVLTLSRTGTHSDMKFD